MTQADQIKAVQAKLGLTADGIAGPRTWASVYGAIIGMATVQPVARPESPATASDDIDSRSESVIATLSPATQEKARQFLMKFKEQLRTEWPASAVKIISGLRSYEEQDALYAQGRTTGGKIVTNARSGHSNHNFGTAFDIGIFTNGKYLDNSPLYRSAGPVGKSIGLAWGGDWKSIQDEPHFELIPSWAKGMSEGDMLAEMRQRKEQGEAIA